MSNKLQRLRKKQRELLKQKALQDKPQKIPKQPVKFFTGYHKTKDPYDVKQLLGHKSLKNTEIYINIEQALFTDQTDEFHVKVAEKTEEIKALLEVGFEYICEKAGLMFFRKHK